MVPLEEEAQLIERSDLAPGDGLLAVAPGGAVTGLAARSPLKLLCPKNHGRAAWVFVASYGGGLVDGDRLRLSVDVAPGAAAYLSTQASTKVYRGAAAQELEARVGAGGLLVSAPDPLVCFAGARYRQSAHVSLADGASFLWVDALSAGRVAHGERWAFGRYESRLVVEQAGVTRVHDALALDPAHGPLPERLGRFAALATLIALGPDARPLCERWLGDRTPLARAAETLVAPSPLASDGCVVRVAAVSTHRLQLALRALLEPLARILGDDPMARKG